MSDIIEKYKTVLTEKKGAKWILLIGAAGLVLILLSGFFTGSTSVKTDTAGAINVDQYKAELQNELVQIVEKITGNSHVQVMITLNSGIQYVYADQVKQSGESGSGASGQGSSSSEQNYVILNGTSGSQQPLVITELPPSVKGVVVACEGGGDPATAQTLTDAVTTALQIPSEKVYVTAIKQ